MQSAVINSQQYYNVGYTLSITDSNAALPVVSGHYLSQLIVH